VKSQQNRVVRNRFLTFMALIRHLFAFYKDFSLQQGLLFIQYTIYIGSG